MRLLINLESLAWIRQLHGEGKSLRGIAEMLNACGVKLKRAERWLHSGVLRIVSIEVSNGSAGNFHMLSGSSYTADITPSAPNVTVTITVFAAPVGRGNGKPPSAGKHEELEPHNCA